MIRALFNMISDGVDDELFELDVDLEVVAHVVSLAVSHVGKEEWICCVHFASIFKNGLHELTNIFGGKFTLDLSYIVTLIVFFEHFQNAFSYNNIFTVGTNVRVNEGKILGISLSKHQLDMVDRESLFVSQIERGNHLSRCIKSVSR